jgi:hypothetical protein
VTTQADVIGILLRRVGSVMTEVGLDGDTEGGANRSLDSAMVRAYTEMGRTPAAIDEVSDDELGALSVPVLAIESVASERTAEHFGGSAMLMTSARYLIHIFVRRPDASVAEVAETVSRIEQSATPKTTTRKRTAKS